MSNTRANAATPRVSTEDYVTRYTVEYFDDGEDKLVDYIYADSYDEAMFLFEQMHGSDCLIVMCEPLEVPARYKGYDDSANPSLAERLEAARRTFESMRMNEASDHRDRSNVDFVKD